MEKDRPRLLMCHVLMNRDDADFLFHQRLQDCLQLVLGDGEIAIDYCVIVASSKRCPGVHAHRIIDLNPVHRRWPAEGKLHHSVFRLAVSSKNFV